MRKLQVIIFLSVFCVIFSSCGGNQEEMMKQKEELDLCITNLNMIGQGIISFKISNSGNLPENLEVLVNDGILEELPVCPKTKAAYKYVTYPGNANNFKILCPNPEMHIGQGGVKTKTKELYYDTDQIKHKF